MYFKLFPSREMPKAKGVLRITFQFSIKEHPSLTLPLLMLRSAQAEGRELHLFSKY